ncbi:unnamed protein product [Alopecurus aequalis]
MKKTKFKGKGKSMERLKKKQNASKTVLNKHIASEDESGNLVKSCESNLTKQIESEQSESVVSLASFKANLVGSVRDGITDNLAIKVRLPSDRVVIGWLHRCDFKYDLAVVNISSQLHGIICCIIA